MEELVAAAVADLGTVHLVTPREIDALYPVAQPHDPHADKLGHIPYTPAYFAALGTMVARKIHALRTPPFKVIALDCDDTLWRGICGEDGPQGVVVDPPRRALQEFMLAQHAQGMLLTLCSKNNVEDVLDTFRLHPEMVLRMEHFAAWRINWSSKSGEPGGARRRTGSGLDSFILVDDSPRECREWRRLSASAGPDAAAARREIPEFLRHVWAFDRLRVTEEDRARPPCTRRSSSASAPKSRRPAWTIFSGTCKLEVRIAPMSPKDLARVAQLTQRTNQMNFTTVRRSESDIQALLESGKAECLTVHVSDRFGSYGLAGAMIFRGGVDAISIDTFLLSCRALGRGVEHRMLAALGASRSSGAGRRGGPLCAQPAQPAGAAVSGERRPAIPERARRGAAIPVSGGVRRGDPIRTIGCPAPGGRRRSTTFSCQPRWHPLRADRQRPAHVEQIHGKRSRGADFNPRGT
jgi:FkbH-like protein